MLHAAVVAGSVLALGAVVVCGTPGASASGAPVPGTLLPGTSCPAFPADNVWNTPVTGLPVDPDSATWLASMGSATTFLHPDFGPSGRASKPYGIPWTVVPSGTALVPVRFKYASQSDPGPYPLSSSTPIERGSDRHALMVDPTSCTLYETWDTHFHPKGRSTAGSGAIWSLTSDALRPAGWTSADAAGLPILPGLANYDEVAAGMGARFRLDASFTLPASTCAAACQTVLTTLRTYGLILADNGSNWFVQGTADTRWSATLVDQLKQVPARDFEAVDESCLEVAPDSGQALQPGTAAYAAACG